MTRIIARQGKWINDQCYVRLASVLSLLVLPPTEVVEPELRCRPDGLPASKRQIMCIFIYLGSTIIAPRDISSSARLPAGTRTRVSGNFCRAGKPDIVT